MALLCARIILWPHVKRERKVTNKNKERKRDKDSERVELFVKLESIHWCSDRLCTAIDLWIRIPTMVHTFRALKMECFNRRPSDGLSRQIIFGNAKETNKQTMRRTVYHLIWLQSHCVITFSHWVQYSILVQCDSHASLSLLYVSLKLSHQCKACYLFYSIAIVPFLFCVMNRKFDIQT